MVYLTSIIVVEDAEIELEIEEVEEVSKKTRRKQHTDDAESVEENETECVKKTKKGNGKEYVKKKAKARKIRRVTKITVGKKAADKMKDKNKEKQIEDENQLDYEEEVEEEEEELSVDKKTEKRKEEEKVWKEGKRRVDPRGDIHIQGAKLLDPNAELWDEESYLEYFLAFMPVKYIKNEMLPATNKFVKDHGHDTVFTYEEFLHVLGIIYMMEVTKLPERRMYWHTEPDGFFPALNFGKVMPVNRFELFVNVWQLSQSPDMDQQVLDFIDAVNEHLKQAMRAGEVLYIDESMVKAYHRGLNGMMKIIRKPRPIGNEIKDSQ